MDDFTKAYLECALWASTDNSDPETGGDPMDANYSEDDIAPETLERMTRDCARFQAENADALACAYGHESYRHPPSGAEGPDMAGHDFWLTRNGHGAGFWDRDLGKAGEALTRASKAYGSFSLYVGDDGLIYGMEG